MSEGVVPVVPVARGVVAIPDVELDAAALPASCAVCSHSSCSGVNGAGVLLLVLPLLMTGMERDWGLTGVERDEGLTSNGREASRLVR